MVKKTIGILCLNCQPFDYNSLNNGLGGTETWILYISEYLQKIGYQVMIFNDNNYTFINSNQVQFYPISWFDNLSTYHYFEHIFILREYNYHYLNMIKENQCTNNIYFILHDIRLWLQNIPRYIDNDENFFNYDRDINDPWLKEHIKKFFFMSNWHLNENKKYFPIDKCEIIGNGIVFENYDENLERDNSILFSSCFNRGLDILVEKIAPKVRKVIPDFNIYVASYDNNLDNKYNELEYVINLGSLGKSDLYNEIRKHKVWFLPLTHWETFCITILENIANDVNIICPYKYGIQDIMKYFNILCIEDGNYDDDQYCELVSNHIIDKINNYDKYKPVRTMLKNYIKDNYTWEKIGSKLYNIIKTYETNNSYYN